MYHFLVKNDSKHDENNEDDHGAKDDNDDVAPA